MKIAVVDDERLWQDKAIWLMEQYYEGRNIIVSRFESGDQLLEDGREFDGIIMDVEMPGKDGISTTMEYLEKYPDCCIIMLSSHGELVNEGYRKNAMRYVEKTRMKEDFPEALDFLLYLKAEGSEVEMKCIGEGICYIMDEQIRYAEAVGNTTRLVTTEREYRIAAPIRKVLALLDPEKFYQSHRGYGLNWRYVDSLGDAEALLDNGDRIPISQRKMSEARRRFFDYKIHRANG